MTIADAVEKYSLSTDTLRYYERVGLMVFVLVFISFQAACEGGGNSNDKLPIAGETKMNIQIGGKNFIAVLYDNPSVKALSARLPLTLTMSELNGNEKYFYFQERLPSNPQWVGSIKSGDLMLYGTDCLVLFYKSFSTSYSYTGLGYIEDISGLAEALGSGSVVVAFSISGNSGR
jgi:hypothetical protein